MFRRFAAFGACQPKLSGLKVTCQASQCANFYVGAEVIATTEFNSGSDDAWGRFLIPAGQKGTVTEMDEDMAIYCMSVDFGPDFEPSADKRRENGYGDYYYYGLIVGSLIRYDEVHYLRLGSATNVPMLSVLHSEQFISVSAAFAFIATVAAVAAVWRRHRFAFASHPHQELLLA